MRKLVVGLSLLSAFIPLTGMAQEKEPSQIELNVPDDPSLCDGIAGNLVPNCGFETNTFPPWVQSGELGATFIAPGAPATHSGNYGLSAGPVGALGFITQNVPTVAGQTYVMHIWLANEGGTPNEFRVSWGGVVLSDVFNFPPTPYTEYCFQDLPSSGTTTQLSFGYRQDPTFWDLDDIIVTQQ